MCFPAYSAFALHIQKKVGSLGFEPGANGDVASTSIFLHLFYCCFHVFFPLFFVLPFASFFGLFFVLFLILIAPPALFFPLFNCPAPLFVLPSASSSNHYIFNLNLNQT